MVWYNMAWIQIISLFLANAGLIFWFRSESRSDWRHMDQKIDQKFDKMDAEMKEFRQLWYQEMKDFHARLCIIEERRLNQK